MRTETEAVRRRHHHGAISVEARRWCDGGFVSVDIDTREGVRVIRLAGELDLATHDEVDHALRGLTAGAPVPVVVDLRDLSFIDCGGARIIGAARRRAARRGQCLRIDGARGLVSRVIELAG